MSYCDWGRDGDDIALFNQELSGLVADLADLGLGDRATGAQLRNRSAKRLALSSKP